MRRPTRRQALKLVAVSGAGAWLGLALARAPSGRIARRRRILMGTTVNLTVVGDDPDAAEAAADATLARMAELEAKLSRYRPDSDVGILNRTGALERPSRETLEVLRLARRVHALGGGAFDVTILPVLELHRRGRASARALADALARVGQDALRLDAGEVHFERAGMAISLDGIGKGYVVDGGVAVLKRRGFPNVLVDAGGDLMACGRRPSGEPWRIGIRHPRAGRSALLARVEAEDVAVATSGDYFQPFTPDLSQHHILDPRTGRSAPELASATVVAPTAALADGLATLMMVLGPRRARELCEELPGCEAYLVTKGAEVTRTSGFIPA